LKKWFEQGYLPVESGSIGHGQSGVPDLLDNLDKIMRIQKAEITFL
jgi:hypothetical protein